MSIDADLVVKGLERVEANLTRLGRQMGGDAIDRALFAGGMVLEGAAKVIAIQKDIVDTGFLVNSIFTKGRVLSTEAVNKQAALAKAGRDFAPSPQVQRRVVIVSCGAQYAIHNEYGTHRMAARPFMRAAVDQYGQEAVRVVEARIRTLLEGAWT